MNKNGIDHTRFEDIKKRKSFTDIARSTGAQFESNFYLCELNLQRFRKPIYCLFSKDLLFPE